MVDYTLVAAIVAIVVVGFLFVRLSELERRLAALRRLDAKLDALLKHAGVEFDLYGNLPAEVVRALEAGRKIEAIKHYRAATGVGLKEAKEFIEDVQRQAGGGF